VKLDVGTGVGAGVGVGVGAGVGVGVGAGVGVGVGTGVGVGVGVLLGAGAWKGVGVGIGFLIWYGVGVAWSAAGVGSLLGDTLSLGVGSAVGVGVGLDEASASEPFEPPVMRLGSVRFGSAWVSLTQPKSSAISTSVTTMPMRLATRFLFAPLHGNRTRNAIRKRPPVPNGRVATPHTENSVFDFLRSVDRC
jgi:hypothetical protein